MKQMQFGFFLWAPQLDRAQSAPNVLADTLALAEEAEALGFDQLWVAEHHFGNLSLSPSPLLTVSHLAAKTRCIRLGTGVLVLPFHNPVRLAEEIAYADILSEGRLDIGVGAGSHVHESRGLGTQLDQAHDHFLEALDILHMAFKTGRIAYEGDYFQVPDSPMSIMPVQKPHPPIYVAGMSTDLRVTRRMAERGYR